MRRRFVIALSLAAACIAASNDSKLKAAFGNTILCTYPDGRTAEIWLSSNGAYRGEGRRHDMSSGTWRLKGDQICFHQQQPKRIMFNTFCTNMPATKVGQTWNSRAPTGEATTLKLVSGHVHNG